MIEKMTADRLELFLGDSKVLKNTRHSSRVATDKGYIDDYLGRNIINKSSLEIWATAERRKGIIRDKYIAYVWYVRADKSNAYHFDIDDSKSIYELLKRLEEQ